MMGHGVMLITPQAAMRVSLLDKIVLFPPCGVGIKIDISLSVDYDPVERSNWPIQLHWNKLITLAAAWSGLNPAIPSNWTNDDSVLSAAKKGLDYWFNNDYTPADCIGLGGQSGSGCPCGTRGLWNTNWFDQVILIPQLCTTTCLLLEDQLSESEMQGCVRIGSRAYDRSNGTTNGVVALTGANVSQRLVFAPEIATHRRDSSSMSCKTPSRWLFTPTTAALYTMLLTGLSAASS